VFRSFRACPLSALPGWAGRTTIAPPFQAFRTTCGRTPALSAACASARNAFFRPRPEARAWWEARFVAQPVEPAAGSPSLLTGYFAPEYQARDRPDAEFSGAVRARPADLAAGQPYRTRAEIEAAGGPALAWMRPRSSSSCRSRGRAR
jgi:membrane-bound lytic murein transglycosylase A